MAQQMKLQSILDQMDDDRKQYLDDALEPNEENFDLLINTDYGDIRASFRLND